MERVEAMLNDEHEFSQSRFPAAANGLDMSLPGKTLSFPGHAYRSFEQLYQAPFPYRDCISYITHFTGNVILQAVPSPGLVSILIRPS